MEIDRSESSIYPIQTGSDCSVRELDSSMFSGFEGTELCSVLTDQEKIDLLALTHLKALHHRQSDLVELLDRRTRFGKSPPRYVEVGTNRGDFILSLARQHLKRRFLALEVKEKWVDWVNGIITEENLENLHMLKADANLAIPLLIGDGTMKEFYLLFPDPWWKRKHARRRLITPAFLDMIWRKLVPGGVFVFKTDVGKNLTLLKSVWQNSRGFRWTSKAPEGLGEDWVSTNRERRATQSGLEIRQAFLIKEEL